MSGGGSKEQTVGYRYALSIHMGVCVGPVDSVLAITAGDRPAWSGNITTSANFFIDAYQLFGGDEREGGLSGTCYVQMGGPTETPLPILATLQGGLQPAYRGILNVLYRGTVSANNPYVKPWAFKVRRTIAGWYQNTPWYPSKAEITLPSGDKAANPAHIVYECITNPEWGMGYGPGLIDDANFRAAADTFHAEGMGLCLLWARQTSIQDFVQLVMNHAGANLAQDRRTGLFILKPLRGDYEVDELPLFDESNVLTVDSYQRAAIPEAVNEVTVVYTDVTTGLDAGITVQNLANITAQGGVVNSSKKYPGLPNADLAARVGMRDLTSVSTPLARVKMQVNRAGYNLLPGDVIRWSWSKLGVENLVLRILAAGAGTATDGAISLECVEDVFGLPSATYVAQEPSGWQEPTSEPAVAGNRMVQEAGYYQLQRTMSPGDFSVLENDAGFISTLAVRPSNDSIRYSILSRFGSGGDFTDGGRGTFGPSGTLVSSISQTQTSITLTNLVDVDLASADSYAYLGSEVVRIDSFNPLTGVATIGRGCLDSVAVSHASGERLFFAQGFEGADGIERVDGDTVQVKLLPSTGRGTLPEAAAPTDSVVMDQRHYRPYPPGRMRINGDPYPSSITTALTLSWAHRSRLQQNLEGDESGNIGPEAGTTYTAQYYNHDTSALLQQFTGITGTSQAFATVFGHFNARVELWSVRDGLASRQKHSFVFLNDVSINPVVPGATFVVTPSLIPGIAFNGNATAPGRTFSAGVSMITGNPSTFEFVFGGSTYTPPVSDTLELQFSPSTYTPPTSG